MPLRPTRRLPSHPTHTHTHTHTKGTIINKRKCVHSGDLSPFFFWGVNFYPQKMEKSQQQQKKIGISFFERHTHTHTHTQWTHTHTHTIRYPSSGWEEKKKKESGVKMHSLWASKPRKCRLANVHAMTRQTIKEYFFFW